MQPVQIFLEQIRGIGRDLIEMLPQILIAIIVPALTYLVAAGVRSLVRRLLRRTRLRKSLQLL